MTTIDQVKDQLDLVEVVRGYVPALKKSGRTWKSPCPFHSERTPSFIVDPDRGTWHCFGACATGGDVIEFVRRIEHLDFREALQRCAERAGIELRPPSAREVREREAHQRLLRANEAAAVYFQAALHGPSGASALTYAEKRGLDAATVQAWQIGYAPDEWHGLVEHLRARGFTDADLRDAGLAIDADRGLYDRFRDRLIFPTRDGRGRLIGFGARALAAGQDPKYLNTPQTPLFDKSGTLYGLDRAGEEARRADRMVVVEGYMDVIACHQAGIRNVVASMGTSITDRQMTLLQRYTHNVVLMLDADNAGSEATLRGVEVAAGAAERGLAPTVDWRGLVSYQDVLKADIRVIALPDGETQLLQLLVFRSEARPAGRIIDPDTFEDTTNRLLFEAWREFRELDEHLDELDDEVRERLDAVRASAKGIWDPEAIDAKFVEPRVSEIAERLRLRRAQARLLPAAVAVASDLAASRRNGSSDDGLVAEFDELHQRQRALSRRARGETAVESESASTV